jgi:type IV pilus assembly protein PilO
MDRLLELPLQQKLLILIAVMLLIAAGGYFLYIADAQDKLAARKAAYARAAQEHTRLAEFKQKEKLESLIAEEAEENLKIEENKQMLPTEDELPQFIQSIKSDADTVNLEIHRFEVGDRQFRDYYARIPVQVRAVGTFAQIAGFLKTLAAPSKRIVNVADMKLKRLHMDLLSLRTLLGDSDVIRELTDLQLKGANKSGEIQRYIKIQTAEVLNSRSLINAEFTIYAFSYTGQLAPQAKR